MTYHTFDSFIIYLSLIQLFKAAVLPHLTYCMCHLVWHFCSSSDTRKLERLQERGLRAVYKEKHSSYLQLLERAKLPKLLNSRLQNMSILMYKVKHKVQRGLSRTGNFRNQLQDYLYFES